MNQQRIIIIGIVAVIALAAGAYLLLSPSETPNQAGAGSPATRTEHADPALGLSFSYPNNYVLEEREGTNPMKSIILMKREDVEGMRTNPPIGGEGPAVISIHVFPNEKKQFPVAFAMEHTDYSAYNLKTGNDEERVVGGANALLYSADGLYPARYAVVAHGSFVYVFVGQYASPEDPMRADFTSLLESVGFIPEMPAASGSAKIDIGAVCEGALAYMTFPDGTAAERFVAECKDGKHSEVIERWKRDNGITDDRAI